MLLEDFTQQWTEWAHSYGPVTRNQAHGSPANLIDCYAAVDIPEIEGFGLSSFGIEGLRQDPGKTRKNDSDFSMLKYAPSVAHNWESPTPPVRDVYLADGTFPHLTLTTETRHRSDVLCRREPHVLPRNLLLTRKRPLAGWKFYPLSICRRRTVSGATHLISCSMLNAVSASCSGDSLYNDFLVYLPVRNVAETARQTTDAVLHPSDGKLAPEFIQTILDIDRAGFDCDYISERLLIDVTVKGGMLQTKAGTCYRGLIIPGSGNMPQEVKAHIEALKTQGAHILYNKTRAS